MALFFVYNVMSAEDAGFRSYMSLQKLYIFRTLCAKKTPKGFCAADIPLGKHSSVGCLPLWGFVSKESRRGRLMDAINAPPRRNSV